MKPTDILKQEHEMILLALQVLDRCASQMDNGADISLDHLKDITDYIVLFADHFHHHKEEDLLFPLLVQYGVPKEGGPVGAMLTEHDIGRKHVANMKQAISEIKQGNLKAKNIFVQEAQHFSSLLNQHIVKENCVLFHLADSLIPAEEQQKLLEKFQKIEKDKMGDGQFEQLYLTLENLTQIYCNLVA